MTRYRTVLESYLVRGTVPGGAAGPDQSCSCLSCDTRSTTEHHHHHSTIPTRTTNFHPRQAGLQLAAADWLRWNTRTQTLQSENHRTMLHLNLTQPTIQPHNKGLKPLRPVFSSNLSAEPGNISSLLCSRWLHPLPVDSTIPPILTWIKCTA